MTVLNNSKNLCWHRGYKETQLHQKKSDNARLSKKSCKKIEVTSQELRVDSMTDLFALPKKIPSEAKLSKSVFELYPQGSELQELVESISKVQKWRSYLAKTIIVWNPTGHRHGEPKSLLGRYQGPRRVQGPVEGSECVPLEVPSFVRQDTALARCFVVRTSRDR